MSAMEPLSIRPDASQIPPQRAVEPRQSVGRTTRIGRNQIITDHDCQRIVRDFLEHYTDMRPGEASAAISRRLRISEAVIDAVIAAALLEAQGEAATYRHCATMATQMVAERRADSREEFAEWRRRRSA